MKLPHLVRPFLFAFFSLTLSACASSSTRSAAVAEPDQPEVTREFAVKTARSDAATHFQMLNVAAADAQPMGTYWVVELRSANGAGLRYAISRQDGSIRQRSTFQ